MLSHSAFHNVSNFHNTEICAIWKFATIWKGCIICVLHQKQTGTTEVVVLASMMGLAGALQQLNIVTTILKHDPSIGGSNYALQIVLFLAETHNNMMIMADDNDNIHANETCNNNNNNNK